jgi:DNA-directed RNA polymerase specialized sigma24 family protein
MPALDKRARDPRALTENDRLLQPLLESSDRRALDAALEDLFRRAQPAIDAVIGHYRRRTMLDFTECEDVASTVRVRLLLKLQRLARGESEPIATYEGYVARLTYNAVNDVFRGRHPQRAVLKKRLREIALRDPRFAIETTVHGVVCRLNEQASDAVAAPVTVALPSDVGDALETLLRAAAGPLLLDDVLAALQPAGAESPAVGGVDPDTPLRRLQRREDVASLWNEILLLPPQQRSALLLNLRGGGSGSAIALLVLLGITTFDALAAALAMTAEELAAIWGALPLDDLTIAERLGITRQQVINLRKSARRRLERRRGAE